MPLFDAYIGLSSFLHIEIKEETMNKRRNFKHSLIYTVVIAAFMPVLCAQAETVRNGITTDQSYEEDKTFDFTPEAWGVVATDRKTVNITSTGEGAPFSLTINAAQGREGGQSVLAQHGGTLNFTNLRDLLTRQLNS